MALILVLKTSWGYPFNSLPFFFSRDMEKEKLKLSLKHIPSRRLTKVLSWLTKLLERVPRGEDLSRDLTNQLRQLLPSQDSGCGDGAASLRLELHNLQERISNLRAGLLTWQDHLLRVRELMLEAIRLAGEGEELMEEPRQLVEAALPSDLNAVQEDLQKSKVPQLIITNSQVPQLIHK